MSEQPFLSVVIVSYNTREQLGNCLRSLSENPAGFQVETLVADNASVDGSPEMVANDFPTVRLIKIPENLGFAGANNRAIHEARGKHLLLLNSDTLVLPGALEEMVRAMENNPKAGAVGCRLLNADGTLQRSLRTFPNFFVHFIEMLELYRLLGSGRLVGRVYPHNSDHRQARWIDWVPGACMLIRGKAMEQVGLLDEGYFMYAEDMDLCYRMKKHGWLTFFTPEAEIVHFGGGSSAPTRGKLIVEQYRSLYRFYQKHYSSGSLLGLKLLAFALSLPKVLLLLALGQGKPHRRELREAYWQVALLGFRGRHAVR
ncbi:MAG: glycosyltransferase family 2 protein [Dehalococcoidia bacterium]|nr:glycosyltransferase family 2 protein [Dehalococcoidia bacterium]